MVPRRHHTVPQFLLKNFCDRDGYLFVCDRRRPESIAFRTKPKSCFVEKHYYAQTDKTGKRDPSIEIWLSVLESNAAKIIKKIIEAAARGKSPNLTADEKKLWDIFFLVQWKRIPELVASLEIAKRPDDFFEAALAKLKQRRELTENELAEFHDTKNRERIIRNAKAQSVQMRNIEAEYAIATRGLCILRITNPERAFVIGSFPTVKFNHPGRTHISDYSVEVWLPVSSQVAIGLGSSAGAEKLVRLDDPAHIRYINQGIASQSRAVAGRAKALVEAIATKSPLKISLT